MKDKSVEKELLDRVDRLEEDLKQYKAYYNNHIERLHPSHKITAKTGDSK